MSLAGHYIPLAGDQWCYSLHHTQREGPAHLSTCQSKISEQNEKEKKKKTCHNGRHKNILIYIC